MTNHKSLVEQYREKLKERDLYNTFFLDNQYENLTDNQLKIKLNQNNNNLNTNNHRNYLNNNKFINNNQTISNKINNNIYDNNNKNINTINDENIKQNWFNKPFLNGILESSRTPEVKLNNLANNGRRILNQRYVNYNGGNIPNTNIETNNNYKSMQLNPRYNGINNNNIINEKINLSKSNDNIYQNRDSLNNYMIPYDENYLIDKYNRLKHDIKIEEEKKRIKNIAFERKIQIMNNLFGDLKKNEKLENKLIEEWKNNNFYGYKSKKERGKKENFNIIFELQRVKRKNMDLENQIIARTKKLNEEEKWKLENDLIQKKCYNYNNNENNRMEKELEYKNDKIKELEIKNELLEKKFNNEKKDEYRLKINQNENGRKKLEDRNKEIDIVLDKLKSEKYNIN